MITESQCCAIRLTPRAICPNTGRPVKFELAFSHAEMSRFSLGLNKSVYEMIREDDKAFVVLAVDIISAYVSNNSIPTGELPSLIDEVHTTLLKLANGAAHLAAEAQKPAVPTRKSITSDFIVCLEDGKKFKSLKRHLRTQYGMSPDEYREKWGLAADYPMVAPNYARARSHLARQMGLGQKRRRTN